jgi:hypothetical protein
MGMAGALIVNCACMIYLALPTGWRRKQQGDRERRRGGS